VSPVARLSVFPEHEALMSQTTTDTRSQLLAAVWRLEPVSFYGQGPDRPVERQWRAPDIHATAQEVRTG
jgi:hypothetical protein